ncbi:uncharacterized protein si:ch211-227n13.3 isoform X2 [Alosa alosa]|nr:uncharacterized protein si:ch211-227n13.3 isoform X2 [Alosa alosa]
MRQTKRREADGTLKVECVIEEVEIRRNVKHLTMNQSKAADQFQTNGVSPSKPFKKRFSSKIVLDDESNQDLGAHDLIDLINSPHSRHDRWTKSSESPMWGLNGDSSPAMHSVALLSDGGQSDAACSDTESVEIILGSESEDDERLNLSMSQYSGPNVSPELSTTPLSQMLSLSKSQEPSANSGAEAGLKFMSGSYGEDSALIGCGKEPPIAIGSEDEDLGDRNVTDSCCSIASGPSRPWQPVPQGPCSSCLAVCVRMKRLTNWTKSRVKDPACLYYDQWMLLKPWQSRGVHGHCRVRGKLFKHLPRIWQHAKVQAEEDLDDECGVCSRPHVFLQRNLRQCKRSQSKLVKHTKVRNKAGSRRGRRSKDHWPPLPGQHVKKRRSKSVKDSIKKKKKRSVGEKQGSSGRREETSGTEVLHEDSQTLGDEHLSYDDVTADCSTEEQANLSPDRRQDMNADIQTNGCPDKHGNVNALSPSEWPANANVGSPSHTHTGRYKGRYTGSSPDSREDRPRDLRADRHRDEHVDGHREKQRSNQRSVLEADGQTGVKAFKCVVSGSDRDVGGSTDTSPIVHLHRCDCVNGNVKQADCLRKAPHNSRDVKHKGAGKHSCWSTDRPTGSDVDVSLNRNADDEGRCLNNEKRKSHPGDALSRHLGVDPNIHLNSLSNMNGDDVLDDSDGHLDRHVEGSSDELVDLSTAMGITRRALLFEDPPTLPLMNGSSATPVVGSVQTQGHTAVPLSKDPYMFRTPTPPGIEAFEVVRKLRPFARTLRKTWGLDVVASSPFCALWIGCTVRLSVKPIREWHTEKLAQQPLMHAHGLF